MRLREPNRVLKFFSEVTRIIHFCCAFPVVPTQPAGRFPRVKLRSLDQIHKYTPSPQIIYLLLQIS